jgi:hypothetical protein
MLSRVREELGTQVPGTLNKRRYSGYNSQNHTKGVYVTPFTVFEPVHDCDSANNAAGPADQFPVKIFHFSSSRASSVGESLRRPPQYRAASLAAHDPDGVNDTRRLTPPWSSPAWAAAGLL